jgi:putative FmdB family regulatory protein
VPRYDFRCTTCDQTYEVSRPMAEADAPATCPDGHVGAVRLLPVFATTGSATAPPSAGAGGCCGGGCCS